MTDNLFAVVAYRVVERRVRDEEQNYGRDDALHGALGEYLGGGRVVVIGEVILWFNGCQHRNGNDVDVEVIAEVIVE